MTLGPKLNHLDPSSSIIECRTCKAAISALAAACPACGAPNEWRHPAIEAFIAQGATITTTRPFNYWHEKTSLRGETKARTPWWSIALGLLIICPALIGAALRGPTVWDGVWMFVGFLLIFMKTKKDWFRADLKANTWTSNNEKFWRPVREILKV